MSASTQNNFPQTSQRHVARTRWQRFAGAEPCIDLDTMLDLTAKAEVNALKFDGVDLFLLRPAHKH